MRGNNETVGLSVHLQAQVVCKRVSLPGPEIKVRRGNVIIITKHRHMQAFSNLNVTICKVIISDDVKSSRKNHFKEKTTLLLAYQIIGELYKIMMNP